MIQSFISLFVVSAVKFCALRLPKMQYPIEGKTRILFAVTTSHTQKDQFQSPGWVAVASTWGRTVFKPHALKFYAGGMTQDSSFQSRIANCSAKDVGSRDLKASSRSGNVSVKLTVLNLCPKDEYPPVTGHLAIWEHMKHEEGYDWYMRCDDDAYVNVKEVIKILSRFSSKQKYYMGRQGLGREEERDQLGFGPKFNQFAMGGFCEIFSRGAASALHTCRDHIYHSSRERNIQNLHSDVELGRCFAKEGIKLTSLPSEQYVTVASTLDSRKQLQADSVAVTRISAVGKLVIHPVKKKYEMVFLHETILPTVGSGSRQYVVGENEEKHEQFRERWQKACRSRTLDKDIPKGNLTTGTKHFFNDLSMDLRYCTSSLSDVRGVGVTKAYIICLMKMLEDGVEHAFIFEHDALPFSNALCQSTVREKLLLSLPSTSSVLLLGGHGIHQCGEESAVLNILNQSHLPLWHLFPTKRFFGLYGWAIRRSQMVSLISLLAHKVTENLREPIALEDIISKWAKTSKQPVYISNPLLVDHPRTQFSKSWQKEKTRDWAGKSFLKCLPSAACNALQKTQWKKLELAYCEEGKCPTKCDETL